MVASNLIGEPPSGLAHPPAPSGPPALAALPRRYLIEADARRAATAPDAPPRLRVTSCDTETGQAVFLKLSDDGEAIRREADILARLAHPGLAQLVDWGMHAGGGYLVLELVPGVSLERRLRDDGPARSTRPVRPLIETLADAVAAVHQAGILHRDLKPANIIVRPDGDAVIIDFGAALALVPRHPSEPTEDFASDGYAAPEQYQEGGEEGPWTDVYALAAIAYRIVAGAPPPPALLRLEEGGDRLPALDRIAAADPALAAAIAWGLTVNPGDRPRSVAEWSAALLAPASMPDGPAMELAAPALPLPLPDQAADIRREDADGGGDGPPTLPIIRYTAATPSFAAVSPLLSASAPSAGSRRRVRFLTLLLVGGLLVPAAGWLVGPSYRRQVLKEWTVDVSGDGDTRTIGEAIAQAPEGARIRIRAGTYVESLVLDRPLVLEAADPTAAPVLAPTAGSCLVIDVDGAVVRGLVMRGTPAPTVPPVEAGKTTAPVACVVVTSGSALVEGNRIAASPGPAIAVEDGATPVIRGNTVTETPTPSIRVVNGARPTIENNTIDGSGSLLFTAGGGGRLQGNRIRDARASAIQIAAGADPEIVDNMIERPAEAGIYIYDGGKGRITGNEVVGAGLSGIVVAAGVPEVVANTIKGAGEHGILVLQADGGRIADNVIQENKGHGIVVGADAVVALAGNRIEGNRAPEIVDLRRR